MRGIVSAMLRQCSVLAMTKSLSITQQQYDTVTLPHTSPFFLTCPVSPNATPRLYMASVYFELCMRARSYSAIASAMRPSSLTLVPRSVRAIARLACRVCGKGVNEAVKSGR